MSSLIFCVGEWVDVQQAFLDDESTAAEEARNVHRGSAIVAVDRKKIGEFAENIPQPLPTANHSCVTCSPSGNAGP